MKMHTTRARAFATAVAIGAAGLAGVAARPASAGPQQGVSERINDRLMLELQAGVALETFASAFTANHPGVTLTPVDVVEGRPIHLLAVGLPPGADDPFIDALEADLATGYAAFVAFAEFLYPNAAPEGHTGSTFVDGILPHAFAGQYAADLLGLEAAHARSTGVGTVVAILDTGIDASHPALASQVLANGADFISGGSPLVDVGDGINNDGDATTDELVGHGTFVAGLVNLVAPGASLMPVRVLDSDGHGDAWILTKGVYHAIDHGVEVINVSLGSTYNAAGVERAIELAEGLGIVVFAAAGNLDRSVPEEYPAMRQGLGVAALDHTDVKAEFSNYSERLFISAPGASATDPLDLDTAIVSTLPGGEYGVWEGTSFATPLVAGVAALVRAQHQHADPAWQPPGADSLADLIEDSIALTAVNIDALNPAHAADEELGAGRVDAAAAADLAPEAPALGDLDHSGAVGFADLTLLLVYWGEVHSSADLDGSGSVGFSDLTLLLVNWG